MKELFNVWKQVCSNHEQKLLMNWSSLKNYTNAVLYNCDAVIYDFAKQLNLEIAQEYYSIDAVFYKPSDKVSPYPKNGTWTSIQGNWLKRIRIAFEHENCLDGVKGGYQEISHLLILQADYKILVGYGERESIDYAEDYASIITSSGHEDKILFIYGQTDGTSISWDGYILSEKGISKL